MSIDTIAGPIPEAYVEFCKTVARLGREAGFESIGLTIRPGFRQDWSDPIQMNWQQGRHGDDSLNMAITSTVMIRANLDASSAPPAGGADHGR